MPQLFLDLANTRRELGFQPVMLNMFCQQMYRRIYVVPAADLKGFQPVVLEVLLIDDAADRLGEPAFQPGELPDGCGVLDLINHNPR